MPPSLTLHTHLNAISAALRHPHQAFHRAASTHAPPSAPILLFYGYSLGELNAAYNILSAVAYAAPTALAPAPTILFTSPTPHALHTLAPRLPALGPLLPAHTLLTLALPLNSPSALRRFLTAHHIHTAIFIEHRLPHLLISQLRRHQTPLLLLDARPPPVSRLCPLTRALNAASHANLTTVTTQTPAHARRLRPLTSAPIHLATSLKFLTPHSVPATPSQLIPAFCRAMSKLPVWLAASTHPPDEPVILAAHRALRRRHARLENALLIVAPRRPSRGSALQKRAVAAGFDAERICRRSEGHVVPPSGAAVYIADTLGELPVFYSAAAVALIGNSFGRKGEGHNFAEAAHFGVPVIHGPRFSAFAPLTEIVGRVTEQDSLPNAGDKDDVWRGPCMEAEDGAAVERLVSTALLHSEAASKLGEAFRDAVDKLRETAEREVVQLVEQTLDRAAARM